MAMSMLFPRIQPQQVTSIYAQQTTSQQTNGIDISSILNLMLPFLIMIAMIGAIAGVGNSKAKTEAKKFTTAG
jgi:hypothetical protein